MVDYESLAKYHGKNSVLELSIDDFELSVRVVNCLEKAGCETIGDAYNMPWKNLRAARNFGTKSWNELMDLFYYKLKLPRNELHRIQGHSSNWWMKPSKEDASDTYR